VNAFANRTPVKPAKGTITRTGERQIVCCFDEDTFAEITEIAISRGVSFRAAIRELVEFGLEDVKLSLTKARAA
jgi:hypothetical protein